MTEADTVAAKSPGTDARPVRSGSRHTAWRRLRPVAAVALVVAAFGLPLLGADSAQQYLLAYMMIVAILAVSLHFLMGIAGLFSLGQAAFFGVGAYSGVVLMDKLGLDAVLALPAVLVVGAATGLVMAVTTLRSSDLYLALTTLALGFIGENVVRNVDYLGGAQGLSGFDLRLAGSRLDDPKTVYWVGLVGLLVLIVVVVSMRASRLGRALMAARESPIAAKSIGVNTRVYRMWAFALSGAFCALAGCLYTAYAFVLDPSVFGLDLTISVLTIAIVGGIRSMPGVIAAALALTYFRNSVEGFGIAKYVLLSYGVLVVLVLLFLPGGMGGLFTDLRRRLSRADHEPVPSAELPA